MNLNKLPKLRFRKLKALAKFITSIYHCCQVMKFQLSSVQEINKS